MTELQKVRERLHAEMGDLVDRAVDELARQEEPKPPAGQNGRGSPTSAAAPGSSTERIETMIGQIADAYKNLAETKRAYARAERARQRYERRIRIDNADALKAAKNERTEKLHIERLLDSDQYRKLQDDEKKAELDHFEARAEVDRLQLTVKLLRTAAGADGAEEARA